MQTLHGRPFEGKAFDLSVPRSSTIHDIKQMIQVSEGTAPADQRLIFNGKQLQEDDRTLQSYIHFLAEDSPVSIFLVPRCTKLNIGTSNGRTITIFVTSSDRVHNTKKQISEKEGLPQDQVRLVVRGKILEDDCYMEQLLGISSGATVFLLPPAPSRLHPAASSSTLAVFDGVQLKLDSGEVLEPGDRRRQFVTHATVLPGVVSIPDADWRGGGRGGVFRGCTAMSSVDLPEGLVAIGKGSFRGCRSLVTVKLPDGITTIGCHAFQGCRSLVSINFPETLTASGEYAFSGCTRLYSISLPEGLFEVSVGAFSGCTALYSVFLPESLTSIGECAFAACTALSDVSFPEGYSAMLLWRGSSNYSAAFSDSPLPKSAFQQCTFLEKSSERAGCKDVEQYIRSISPRLRRCRRIYTVLASLARLRDELYGGSVLRTETSGAVQMSVISLGPIHPSDDPPVLSPVPSKVDIGGDAALSQRRYPNSPSSKCSVCFGPLPLFNPLGCASSIICRAFAACNSCNAAAYRSAQGVPGMPHSLPPSCLKGNHFLTRRDRLDLAALSRRDGCPKRLDGKLAFDIITSDDVWRYILEFV